MSLTILIDLDNTLISNDMDRFIPAYLQKLSNYLPDWPSEKVIYELLAGTRAMIAKNTPAKTLMEVFDEVFYRGLGVDKDALKEKIESFYRDEFPSLQGLTSPRPEAVRVMEYLFEKNYLVAIATNPVFPRTAILQRLAWAGLPVERYPFKLVTSFEEFHFSKPHSAYLAEILAQMGWPDQPAVMIGDRLEEEIIPAGKLGIPAFWISENREMLPAGLHSLSSKGRLADVVPWLKTLKKQPVDMQFSTPASILAILKSTPAALQTLTANLSREEWSRRPSDNEWSLTEIACHLRDVDREVNLPRIKLVSSGQNPFIPGVVTDIWAEERDYLHQDGQNGLAFFLDTRTELIQLLGNLDEQSWKLPARHTIFGPTQLVELAGFISTHDRTHIHQAFETVRRIRKSGV
ncbi:MAG TPA: DinB family protein [Anaerolineaceae bacterium]|nr:DinB family protein [Anaerolineaceae bacterium]